MVYSGRTPESNPKYRTKTCHHWLMGKCFFGDGCKYLHDYDENIDINSPSPPSIKTQVRQARYIPQQIPSGGAGSLAPPPTMGSFTYPGGNNAQATLVVPPPAMGTFTYNPGSNVPGNLGGGRASSNFDQLAGNGFSNSNPGNKYGNKFFGYNRGVQHFQQQDDGPEFAWVNEPWNNTNSNLSQQQQQGMIMHQQHQQHHLGVGGQQIFHEPYHYKPYYGPYNGNNTNTRRRQYVPAGQQSEGFKPNYSRPCRYFVGGHCKFGDACKYFHPTQEEMSLLPQNGNGERKQYRGRSILEGVGYVVAEIKASEIKQGEPSGTIGMSDYELITSYSWAKDYNAISVPGSPALWTEPELPMTISPDKGIIIVDHNEYRSPQYPLEPIFRAIQVKTSSGELPSVNEFLSSVNVVSDRNNLRKLLAFVTGGHSKGGEALKPFRIDFSLMGKTLVLGRWNERVSYEKWGSLPGRSSFGHNFETAVMKYDNTSEGGLVSDCHNRIVKFNLGGLKVLMRFEVDGYDAAQLLKGELEEDYVKDKDDEKLATPTRPVVERTPSSRARANTITKYIKDVQSKSDSLESRPEIEITGDPYAEVFHKGESDSDDVELCNAIAEAAIHDSPPPKIEVEHTIGNNGSTVKTEQIIDPVTPNGLTVVLSGEPVPASAIVEVKARYQAANMDELIPQIYFAQTPLLYVGYHDGHSKINIVDKNETYQHVVNFERNQQEELRKLVSLLKTLITVAGNAQSEVVLGEHRRRVHCSHGCGDKGCGHEKLEESSVRKFAAVCTIPAKRRDSFNNNNNNNVIGQGGDGGFYDDELTLRIFEVPGSSDILPPDLMALFDAEHGVRAAK